MRPDEKAFEDHVARSLVERGGYRAVKAGNASADFDPGLGLDLAELFAFIEETQAGEWGRLTNLRGGEARAREGFADRLAPQHFEKAIVDRLAGAENFSYQLLDNDDLSEQVMSAYLPLVYGKAKVAWQEHCPIGELLGPPPKEGAHLEYKSTLRTRADTGEMFKPLQTASLKTIAAFLNSREGGTLLIGVTDDGSVFGLDTDYATLRKAGKDDRDLFGLHLNQAIINAVGMAAAANVGQEILEVGGKDLCRVHVRPSSFPVEAEVVEVDANGQHVKKIVFFGRFGNGARQITDPTERERYKVNIWGP